MRLLYATLGVLGGIVGLAFTFLFLQLVMLMGGGQPRRAQLLLIAACVLALTSLLGLVAGFLNPRNTTARWLLLASAGAWLIAAILVAAIGVIAAPDAAQTLVAVKGAATVILPALLPLAALALARWKFAVA